MMPKNLNELIDFNITLSKKEIKSLSQSFCTNSTIFEVLHLSMRFIYPENKAAKFDKKEFKRQLFKKDNNAAQQILSNVSYSKISSQIYKEVKKRKALWNIDDEVKSLKDKNYLKFI